MGFHIHPSEPAVVALKSAATLPEQYDETIADFVLAMNAAGLTGRHYGANGACSPEDVANGVFRVYTALPTDNHRESGWPSLADDLAVVDAVLLSKRPAP